MTELLDSFERFAGLLKTENGHPLVLQSWQRDVLRDVLADDIRETLILIGKGNGKTALLAAVALHHLLTTPDARVYIAAASRDQAGLLFGFAQGFVTRSAELESRLIVRPGYREIRCRRDQGVLKVLASDADTADGVGPTLALVDELHRHKNADLYAALRDGLGKRSGSLCTISTAGWDHESPLGMLRRAALKVADQKRDGSHLRAGSGAFVMHEWAVPSGGDTSDLAVVKLANPSDFVTVESLQARRDSPSMRDADWLRFACGQWVSAERSWLADGAWAACEDDLDIESDARVFLGVDIGRKRDSSAIVACCPSEGRVVCRAWVFDSPGGEQSTDLAVIEGTIRDLARKYKVVECAFDPWSFTRSAQLLGDEGVVMVEFPQSNSRMHPASVRLFEAIRDRRVAHDGNPVLAAHVNAGVSTESDRGWRLTKRSAADKVDALIALAMALERAESYRRRVPQVFDMRVVLAEAEAEERAEAEGRVLR